MKPGEIHGSVVVETRQEAIDIQQALFDFSWVENTGKVFNKLGSEVPIELMPNEAILALSALKVAQNRWIKEPGLRARVLKMLSDYQSTFGS